MANRYFNQFRYSLEKTVRDLWIDVSFGASGAPTLNRAKGIQSITRTGAGAYTIQLGAASGSVDTYQRLLSASQTYKACSDSAALMMLVTADNSKTTGQISIKFVVASAPSAGVDPASGDEMMISLSMSDSYAP